MHNGRLIRVRKHRGDLRSVAYIVALADPAKATELIRSQAALPDDEVDDLGRVSDVLLATLKLQKGQFVRT